MTALTTLFCMALAQPALACGFLVAENGAIRLSEFTALAAWEDGVEHYVTSFSYAGPVSSFGAIVPLPAEPTVVEKAGSWTLQRLQREITPPARESADGGESAFAASEAEVVATYEVEALDIAVLRGGGADVLAWTEENGFDLGVADDAGEMLDFYAERSPYFAAVRYDLERAEALERQEGDGTPVHFAFDIAAPWVPLKILTFDKPDEEIVEADVFLLTPERPTLRPAERLDVAASTPASEDLLDDLRDDENSAWVPREAWLTYVDVSIPAGELDFDLAVSVDGTPPSFTAAAGPKPVPEAATFASGVSPDRPVPVDPSRGGIPGYVLVALVATAAAGLIAVALRRRPQPGRSRVDAWRLPSD